MFIPTAFPSASPRTPPAPATSHPHAAPHAPSQAPRTSRYTPAAQRRSAADAANGSPGTPTHPPSAICRVWEPAQSQLRRSSPAPHAGCALLLPAHILASPQASSPASAQRGHSDDHALSAEAVRHPCNGRGDNHGVLMGSCRGGEAKVWLDELKIFQNDLFLSSGIWLIPAREAVD